MAKIVQTAIGDALEKAGLHKYQMQAYTTAVDFINAGGSRSEWVQVYDLVSKRYEPVETKPKPKPALRAKPDTSAADKRAAKDMHKQIAHSVFYNEQTSTGRRWSNIRYDELPSMFMDAPLALSVYQHIGHIEADKRGKLVPELITSRDFTQLLRKSKKVN